MNEMEAQTLAPDEQVQRRRVSARASRDVLTERQQLENPVAREKQDRLVLARLTAHGGQIHHRRAGTVQSEAQNLRRRNYCEWPYRRDESGHERRRAEVHASARAAGRRDFGWRHPRRGLRRYTEGAHQWGRHRRVWRYWYVIGRYLGRLGHGERISRSDSGREQWR